MEARKMRLLRIKHGITRQELGDACGLSGQRISELEFSLGQLRPETEAKLQQGFAFVVQKRRVQLMELERDYWRYRETLLAPVEDTSNEL